VGGAHGVRAPRGGTRVDSVACAGAGARWAARRGGSMVGAVQGQGRREGAWAHKEKTAAHRKHRQPLTLGFEMFEY
jgi:hypothetical protein